MNESVIEKEMRLAKKGKSLEIGNRSDANYDAKQYMVRLRYVLNDYYDGINIYL
jgi:hypothetical protein